MLNQKRVQGQFTYRNIIDFAKYRNKRPFFREPMKIQVKTPSFDTYYMVKNVVYKGKQILVLKEEMDSNTLFLVEANIINGELKNISMLPKEYLGEISGIFSESQLINL